MSKMNWMNVEKYLKNDNRVVVVLGATEEHGDLSVATDTLIPYSIAEKSCKKENVILVPPLYFGISSWSKDYPGTITLKTSTYVGVIEDIMDSLLYSGFRKIIVLNGHGFNRSSAPVFGECVQEYQDAEVIMIQWYEMEALKKKEREIGEKANHANWAENFVFTNVTRGRRTLVRNDDSMPNLLQSSVNIRNKLKEGSGYGSMAVDSSVMKSLEKELVEEFSSIIRNVK